MRILVSNDDGIHAPGIIALANALLPLGEIFVVAPNQERSAASHSLTLAHPLRAPLVRFPVPVVSAWAVNGTPSDCVKIGISQLLPAPPDLVVAGINRGANLCVDVFYSGTVAAAFEGAFADIPAIAFSLDSFEAEAEYAGAAAWARMVTEGILRDPPRRGLIFNVNVPARPAAEIKGIRLTRLGHIRYRESYEVRADPVGRPYYWLRGDPEVFDDSPECDNVTVKDGFVSVTPIRAELTDFAALEALRRENLIGRISPP
jgi:5'-nucleotidase